MRGPAAQDANSANAQTPLADPRPMAAPPDVPG